MEGMMFKSLQVVALMFAVGAMSVSAAHAQQSGVNVAVIDISHVFKNHPRFTSEADKIKAEIKAFEERINNERKVLVEEGEKLKLYTPGSPDYKQTEENLARRTSNLQVEAGLKRKDVLEKESQLYFRTYTEIQGAIKAVATKYSIGLVLRFNSKPIDVNDRNDVLAGINRPVVYQSGIDITQAVMDSLGAQQARPPGTKPKY